MKTNKPQLPDEGFGIIHHWLTRSSNLSHVQFRICVFLIGTYQLQNGDKDYTADEIAVQTSIDAAVVRRNIKSFFAKHGILTKCGTKIIERAVCIQYAFDYLALAKVCNYSGFGTKRSGSAVSLGTTDSGSVVIPRSDNRISIVEQTSTDSRSVVFVGTSGPNHVQEGREGITKEVIEKRSSSLAVRSRGNIENPAAGKIDCGVSMASGSVGPSAHEKTPNDNSQNGQNTAKNGTDTFNSIFGEPEPVTNQKPDIEPDKNPLPSMAPGPKPEKETNSKPFPKSRREQIEASARDYTQKLTTKSRPKDSSLAVAYGEHNRG